MWCFRMPVSSHLSSLCERLVCWFGSSMQTLDEVTCQTKNLPGLGWNPGLGLYLQSMQEHHSKCLCANTLPFSNLYIRGYPRSELSNGLLHPPTPTLLCVPVQLEIGTK